MKRKCSIAVIGVGQRGYSYVEMLKKHPDASLTALCDTSPDRLRAFAKELNCEKLPLFFSVDELLGKGDFEAAVITTPDFTHAACAAACFRSGKHVMLEKPMAPTAAECRTIVEESRKSGKILQVGFVLRHLPLFREVKNLLDAGEIGQLLSMNCSESVGVMHGASYMRRWHRKSANSGGFLLAKCSHDLDLMAQLAGASPARVASFGGLNFFTSDKLKVRFCSMCPDLSCRFRFKGEMVRMTPEETAGPSERQFDLCVYNDDKDVVDNQQVLIEYVNGVRGTFSLDLFAPRPTRRWRLIGTSGYMEADTGAEKVTLSFSDGREPRELVCHAANDSAHGGSDGLFLDEFISCILNGRKPEADAAAGLASTVTGNAIERSRLEGKIVTIAPEEYLVKIDPREKK